MRTMGLQRKKREEALEDGEGFQFRLDNVTVLTHYFFYFPQAIISKYMLLQLTQLFFRNVIKGMTHLWFCHIVVILFLVLV